MIRSPFDVIGFALLAALLAVIYDPAGAGRWVRAFVLAAGGQ